MLLLANKLKPREIIMPVHRPPSSFIVVLTLAFVTFIDTLGLAILYPLLSPLFLLPSNEGLVHIDTSLDLRHFYFGLTLILFPLATFFSAPMMGDLSDQFNRKSILLFCLIGTLFSYLLAAVAIWHHSLILFFLSRVLAGLTAGSQPIAQAAIIDISNDRNKAYHLSLMILAISLGYAGGPLLSGLLSQSNFISHSNLITPLIVAGMLSLINTLLLIFSYHEIARTRFITKKIDLFRSFREFTALLAETNYKKICGIYALFQFAWGFYFQFIAVYLAEARGFTPYMIGIFMTLIAVGFSVASLGLVRCLIRYMTMSNAVGIALISATVLFYATTRVSQLNYIAWSISILVGIVMGVACTYLLTFFSEITSAENQGKVMGITASITALTLIISSVIGSAMLKMSSSAPLVLATLFSFICYFMVRRYHHESQIFKVQIKNTENIQLLN